MTSEYIKAQKQARERLVPQRRKCVAVLAGEFKAPASVDALATFRSLQAAIEALDRAIDDERKIEDARRLAESAREVRNRGRLG